MVQMSMEYGPYYRILQDLRDGKEFGWAKLRTDCLRGELVDYWDPRSERSGNRLPSIVGQAMSVPIEFTSSEPHTIQDPRSAFSEWCYKIRATHDPNY